MDKFDEKIKADLGKNEDLHLSDEQMGHLLREVAKNKKKPKRKFFVVFASTLSLTCIAVISILSVFLFIGKGEVRYSNSDDCDIVSITQQEIKNYVTDDLLPVEELEKMEFSSASMYQDKDTKKFMALRLQYLEKESVFPIKTKIEIIVALNEGFIYSKDKDYILNSEERIVNGIKVTSVNIKKEGKLPDNYRKFTYSKHNYYFYSNGINEELIDILIDDMTK